MTYPSGRGCSSPMASWRSALWNKTAEELICEFVVGGAMRSRKSVNVAVGVDQPAFGDGERPPVYRVGREERRRLHRPLVRAQRAGTSKPCRTILDSRHSGKIKIISKIENQRGARQHRRDHRSVVRHHGGARRPGRGAARRGRSPITQRTYRRQVHLPPSVR